jgi:hypothetical protein
MKVKMIIWADVDEDEYDSATDLESELTLVRTHMVDYDFEMVSRKEWEQEGFDWDEEEDYEEAKAKG